MEGKPTSSSKGGWISGGSGSGHSGSGYSYSSGHGSGHSSNHGSFSGRAKSAEARLITTTADAVSSPQFVSSNLLSSPSLSRIKADENNVLILLSSVSADEEEGVERKVEGNGGGEGGSGGGEGGSLSLQPPDPTPPSSDKNSLRSLSISHSLEGSGSNTRAR